MRVVSLGSRAAMSYYPLLKRTEMTDDDYIYLVCKAVQLADGWGITNRAIYLNKTAMCHAQNDGSEYQATLDALAAQLVRQADQNKAFVVIYRENTQVWIEPDDGPEDRIVNEYGPDRTMNTIKAIVDSKVLE